MTGINLETLGISILTSSIFILLVVVLRMVFRGKISMRLQYALWLFVAINLLLIPIPKIESGLSVQNLIKRDTYSEVSQEMKKQERNTADITFLNQQTASMMNQNKEQVLESREIAQTQDISRSAAIPIGNIVLMIAMSGSVLMLLYFVFYNLRFRRLLHRQRMVFEGYSSKLPIYLVEGLPSPCLYGKAIYITPEVTTNEKKLKHVITHEYCHYRQGDLWWSALRSICLICYWWNPLVWLAAYLSKQDCELACDEAAIRLLGDEERIPYGETLIGLITVKTKPQDYFSIATTMTGSGKSIKQRIRRIARNQKAVISVCIVLVFLVGICFVSMSTDKKEDKGKQENNVIESQEVEAAGQIFIEEQSGLISKIIETPGTSYEKALLTKEIQYAPQTEELTMDRVIAMFKVGSLGDVDYFSFANAETANKEEAKKNGWLNYYVNFYLPYKEEIYRLGASHSVEDDTLQDLYLTRESDMESVLIYTTDDKYIVVKDIEEYLNYKVQMSDLLSIELPQGFTLGNYMANIGIDGGALIEPLAYAIREEELISGFGSSYGSGIPEWFYSGTISIIRYPQDWFVFEDGKLVDKQMIYWNHTSEEKIEVLEGLAMPAILYHANHDLYTAAEIGTLYEQGIELTEEETTSDYWYIYFASPESEIAYYLSLDARQFSKEQAIEIARSVRFAEIGENTEETTPKAEPTTVFEEEVNTVKGVSMELVEVTPTSAKLTILNTTDMNIQYGADYDLQILLDGNWYSLSYIIDNAVFEAIGYMTQKNVPREVDIDWTIFHGVLEPGQYRIVKEVMDFRGTGDYTEYNLAVEFMITETGSYITNVVNEDAIFSFQDDEYDLSDKHVNAVIDSKKMGQKILVEGHVSPYYSYYGIFDIESRGFIKDIYASALAYKEDKVDTIIYVYDNEVYNYAGNQLARLDIKENEYIRELYYDDSQEYVIVEVGTDNSEETRTVKIHLEETQT